MSIDVATLSSPVGGRYRVQNAPRVPPIVLPRDEASRTYEAQGFAVTGWNKLYNHSIVQSLPILGRFNMDLSVRGEGVKDSKFETLKLNFSSENISPDSAMTALLTCYADALDVEPDSKSYWWRESNGARFEGYTVENWIKANGTLKWMCKETEPPRVEVTAIGLVPGALYTLWGFYYDRYLPFPRGLQGNFPYGGMSNNVFVADVDGKISTTKRAPSCAPKDDAQGPDTRYKLINLFLAIQPDGKIYEAGVRHPLMQSSPYGGPGCAATPHLMFVLS